MTTVFAMLLIVAFTCYAADDGIIKGCYQKENGQLRILTYQKDCNKDCDKGHNKDCDKDHDKDCDKDGYTSKCRPQSEVAIQWPGGVGIVKVEKNTDGTIKLYFTDGNSYTIPTFGITQVVKNTDGTIKLYFTDGNSYTIPTFGITQVVKNTDGTITVYFTDGNSYTIPTTISAGPQTCAGTVCYDDLTPCNGDHIASSCATVDSNDTGYYQIAFKFDQPPICVIYPYQPYRFGIAAFWIWTEILSPLKTGMEVNTYIRSGDSRTDVDADFNFICTSAPPP